MKISMKFLLIIVCTLSACFVGQQTSEGEADLMLDRDHAAADARTSTGSPLMIFHNGDVLAASKTEAVFWGAWSQTDPKIAILDSFFEGFSASAYASIGDEYYGANGQVTSTSTYLGHVFDSSAAPRRAISVSTAVAEACKIAGGNPDPAALYLIYTSTGAGHVNYCAWHSYGACPNGMPVQVAYMPNLDGVAGCNPNDTWTAYPEGASALANVTAHELMETITDPRAGGWYDSSGNEIGDKCAWSFEGPVTLSNGAVFKLQTEWSNAAYQAGTGFANLSGQPGCSQGQ